MFNKLHVAALGLGLFLALPLHSSSVGAVPDASASALQARKLGEFASCQLTHPDQLMSFAAQCLEIELAERAGAERRIHLSLVKLPAVSGRDHDDPLVLLAGGPGGDAQSMYTQVASVFARVGRERDILLLDQRGTGRSNAMRCAQPPDELLSADVAGDLALLLARTRECRDALAKTHDLAAYTTSQAVRDLEAVRQLLGYEQFNLYAVSYGTRVAQHYARRYPARVRTMVLDGVVAPATVLGPGLALDAEAALTGIFDRCAADPLCSKEFPDLATRTRALLATLQRAPIALDLPHPRTGASTSLQFAAPHLKLVLRMSSYQAAQAAMLPVLLQHAIQGDFRPLASLYLLTVESLATSLAAGMHNTVICSEDLARLTPELIDRQALQSTYIGAEMIDSLQAVCADWPRGPVDPDFHEPLQSSLPVLLLSGSLDPVTPPADAAKVAAGLSNARHLILPGEGHGQLGLRCMDRVLADFFVKADPTALDVSCLDKKLLPPFWMSLAGPAP